MIGVVISAHNESEYLSGCLRAVFNAARARDLRKEPVTVIVVLDACTDETASLARQFPVKLVSVNVRNVGIARARGADLAIQCGARWLAFTDADSAVASDWLVKQLSLGTDAVCGTVEVRTWHSYGAELRRHFSKICTDADGHKHIHGANLGVSVEAYEKAGGFRPLSSSEDVALVSDLARSGASIAWPAAPRVVTSARRDYRVMHGFGASLARLHGQLLGATAGPTT